VFEANQKLRCLSAAGVGAGHRLRVTLTRGADVQPVSVASSLAVN